MYCCTPKALTIMCGGSLLNHHHCCSIHLDDATAATRQRRQCAHHTTQLQVERERVIEPIKCMLSPHTSYRWRGERVIEPIKCMLSPHTSYRWRGERVIEPIKWMGIIRRPWSTRTSGGNLARTSVTPLLFTMSVMGFLMTTESQDVGLTSHPKDGAFLQYSVPVTILGH